MTVSIPCASCAQQIRWGQRACTGCGRPISSDENRALEARFEAMHADFRNAKTSLLRGLTAALVAGLMIMTIAGLRVLLITQSFDPASLAPAVADFIRERDRVSPHHSAAGWARIPPRQDWRHRARLRHHHGHAMRRGATPSCRASRV
jgi:hypothetical protein